MNIFIVSLSLLLAQMAAGQSVIGSSPIGSGYVKSGSCPVVSGFSGSCARSCSSDNSCTGSQKCCYNGCGYSCQYPRNTIAYDPLPKSGTCPTPVYPVDFSACDNRCGQDWECSGSQKCCSNGCGTRCQYPRSTFSTGPRAGQCPSSSSLGVRGGCSNQCTADNQCSGSTMKCCRNSCASVCVDPRQSAIGSG